MDVFGFVRSSRSHYIRLFVHPAQVFLENQIFIFLSQALLSSIFQLPHLTSYDRRSLLIPCLVSSLTGTCKKWNADAEVSILSLNVSLLLYCVVSVLTSADMCWLLSPPQGVVCVVTVSASQRAA